jgi:hypothetical protein
MGGKRIGLPVNLKRPSTRTAARLDGGGRVRKAGATILDVALPAGFDRPRATGCRCAPSNALSRTRRPIPRAPASTVACWPA